MVVSSSSVSSLSPGMDLLVLFCGWVYVVGNAEFSHSWFDIYVIVSKVSHKGSCPNQYVVVLLKVDSILCTGTRFLGYMDCELVADDEGHNQHAGSCFDL